MIYDRIKKICKDKGITVAKLERDLELGRSSVRRFDQHDPSIGKMHMIAGYLGVTVDDLLDDKYESNKGPDALSRKMFVDKDMRDIYEMKSNMSADRFALYKKLLEEMYRAEQGGESN